MKEQELIEMTYKHLKAHGLIQWTVKIKSLKTRIAQCRTLRRALVPEASKGVIEWSREFAEFLTEAEALDTTLHEIAHALVPHAKTAHGPEWKAMAIKLGAKPTASKAVPGAVIESKYTGECPQGHKFTRNRISWENRYSYYCPACKKNPLVAESDITWYDTKEYKNRKKVTPSVPAVHKVTKVNNLSEVKPKVNYRDMYDKGHTMLDDSYLGD